MLYDPPSAFVEVRLNGQCECAPRLMTDHSITLSTNREEHVVDHGNSLVRAEQAFYLVSGKIVLEALLEVLHAAQGYGLPGVRIHDYNVECGVVRPLLEALVNQV